MPVLKTCVPGIEEEEAGAGALMWRFLLLKVLYGLAGWLGGTRTHRLAWIPIPTQL